MSHVHHFAVKVFGVQLFNPYVIFQADECRCQKSAPMPVAGLTARASDSARQQSLGLLLGQEE